MDQNLVELLAEASKRWDRFASPLAVETVDKLLDLMPQLVVTVGFGPNGFDGGLTLWRMAPPGGADVDVALVVTPDGAVEVMAFP